MPAGPSPQWPIATNPTNPDWFRRHSSWVQHAEVPGVGASGARGITSLVLTLVPTPSPYALQPADPLAERDRSYTVRLHFVEPDGMKAGRRLFHVSLQGREVLHDLDVAGEAGGPMRALVKEFRSVSVKRDLEIRFSPSSEAECRVPMLSSVEVVAEDAAGPAPRGE